MKDIIFNTKSPIMGKRRTYRYNNSELIIVFGDITQSKTDVIVCSDDNLLSASGGTSRAVRKVCGDVVLHDIQKKTNAELGDVVVTTAGNLPHKFLFHCITVDLIGNSDKTQEEKAKQQEYIIQHSISKCLRLLTSLDLSSIAFSCIGAGYAAFDFERVGRVMSSVMSDFLLKTNKSYHLEIYLYGIREDFDIVDYIAFFEQFALRASAEKQPLVSDNNEKIQDDEQRPSVDGNKYDVFVSYSRQDKEKAELICKYLKQYNISHWIDREGVHHGNNFKVEIIEAIQASTVLLFISSVNSNKSPNTVKEVSIAEKYGKVVIPIRIDDSAYDKSLEYDLCNRDWMDFQEDVDYDASAKKLYENLRFYLDREKKVE